ncbi:MAG: fumarylacetoacetate hydrolase family protein, partial [Phycisphaerales bacterium]|nr:fumarylacetoacetate hydrolase family protein [Phycisphaerales bacterium]
MPYAIDETHDPNLKSWVESANDPETDFPIQNLPLAYSGSYMTIIGDQAVDLTVLESAGLLKVNPNEDENEDCVYLWHFENLLGGPTGELLRWPEIRRQLSHLFAADTPDLRDNEEVRAEAMQPLSEVEFESPVDLIGDYTDFYASINHATNVGSMFRPDNPLLPNYKHIPIGYHGRASSIVPSGTSIKRPIGQQAPAEDGGSPQFGPCKLLDYEMEMGAIIGRGNALGESISIHDAEDHILGMCILNDWSARDLQKWE